MIRHRFLCAGVLALQAFGVAGCGSADLPKGSEKADLRSETVRGDRPAGPTDACWAEDQTPAVIETVTERIPEAASADQDAGYRTESRQVIVEPREQIWFRTPCEAALTPDVIATLQRALAARGFYEGEPTEVLDAATRSAIRAYQGARGLNSDRLSLAAARDLGVIAADLGDTNAA
jgi:hypothetical protein